MMVMPHEHECICGARWDEDNDPGQLAVYKRAFEFLEALSDGGSITVNGRPWRDVYEGLQNIVPDPLPLPPQPAPLRQPVTSSQPEQHDEGQGGSDGD